jgi:hypothetical protein
LPASHEANSKAGAGPTPPAPTPLRPANGAEVTEPFSIVWSAVSAPSDVAQAKSQIGQLINATNFRADVNANGSINASDVAIIKSSIGMGIP